MGGGKLEVVNGEDPQAAWEKEVREAGKDRCGNCGSDDHHVRVRMIVPVEAGGQYVVGNGMLLCRACDLTLDLTTRHTEPVRDKRPVNFWVSRQLFHRLQTGSSKTSFRSSAGLLRFLMSKYVLDPERFDDLGSYVQDSGMDVKVSVWVEADIYGRFKELTTKNGFTVTDALKGLISMFEAEAAVLFEK
jgi:hypothetical protein